VGDGRREREREREREIAVQLVPADMALGFRENDSEELGFSQPLYNLVQPLLYKG
jgi:hypothetical protein